MICQDFLLGHDMYLLVRCLCFNLWSQTSGIGESGPKLDSLWECRASPPSHINRLQVAAAGQVIFQRARPHI